MTDSNEKSKEQGQRLLSAGQAGWALTLATILSLLVGVVVVGGLGGGSPPPLEINGTGKPVATPGPQFHILEPDSQTHASGSPSNIRRTEWVESMFLPRPATDAESDAKAKHPTNIAQEPLSDVLR